MKFNKITKKKFIEVMTSSNVIFVKGGFIARELDEELEQFIIEMSEDVLMNSTEYCKCIAKSNSLVRILPDGNKSYLYFDNKCKERNFYEYANIFIREEVYENSDRRNHCIYLCV